MQLYRFLVCLSLFFGLFGLTLLLLPDSSDKVKVFGKSFIVSGFCLLLMSIVDKKTDNDSQLTEIPWVFFGICIIISSFILFDIKNLW